MRRYMCNNLARMSETCAKNDLTRLLGNDNLFAQ
jgi:hypothetical protein